MGWLPIFKAAVAWLEERIALLEKFGRDPNRNESLGRQSTAAEKEFLYSTSGPKYEFRYFAGHGRGFAIRMLYNHCDLNGDQFIDKLI